jgi:hypothetical protein
MQLVRHNQAGLPDGRIKHLISLLFNDLFQCVGEKQCQNLSILSKVNIKSLFNDLFHVVLRCSSFSTDNRCGIYVNSAEIAVIAVLTFLQMQPE